MISYDSLPVGVVTLAERFGHQGFQPQGYNAMVAYVRTAGAFERVHCISHEIRDGGVRMLAPAAR